MEETKLVCKAKEVWFIRVIVLILFIVFFAFGYCLYRYAPLTVFLQGNWHSNNDSNYHLAVKNNEFILTNKISYSKGYYEVMSWKAKPNRINNFESQEAKNSIVIDKAFFSEEQLKQICEKESYYEVISESNNELILGYTENLVKQKFGVVDLNRLLSVRIIPKGVLKKYIKLENSSFLQNGLVFE